MNDVIFLRQKYANVISPDMFEQVYLCDFHCVMVMPHFKKSLCKPTKGI